ncbi:hypothetical protein INT44_006534 [Umbelopsis vinacea]|uniref:Ubiquinol-cytochrome C reductase hinge domain-containing protein n=1 Tax=Umbelopsis vinacea TaxID=44442 RepID=A0A8H7PUZ0_9FUNG|nr:hypothetical protein INT44_006534 [Umbelopsis vinacea]KAI9283654.1 ubiquinol-cytochrome C reductase hinge protein-domain-containing protein [Umbelopsis sp. AD052]
MALADLLSSFLPTVYAEEEQHEEQPEEPVEEVEEEEPEDPKEAIMEECGNSKECASLKHHLEECAERVENGSHEDCIEEFFHFMHCADACAAPKVFEATV